MKNFGSVFKFEYLGYVTRKSYIGLTLGLILIVAAVVSWPRISSAFSSGDSPAGGGGVEASSAVYVSLYSEIGSSEEASNFFNSYFFGQGYHFLSTDNPEGLEESVSSARVSDAVIIHSDLSYTRIARNIGMGDYFDSLFSSAMLHRYRDAALEAQGISEESRAEILGAAVDSDTRIVESGKDQFSSFIFTYVLIFALYFVILFYGQFVSTSVATEKSTRTMEILITSASPDVLMFGKVTGAGCAGLTQFAAIIAAALASVKVNAQYYENNVIINAMLDMPPSIFVYVLVFFVLGFFLYAFLFAALASLVSRIEDVSTATMPALFLFIIAFFIAMFSMGSGNVDSTLMIVASYIPFSSPMVMFARVAMGDVRTYEVAISIAILAVSTIGVGYLATGIYRLGVLLYGVPPKPGEIIRMLKAQRQQ